MLEIKTIIALTAGHFDDTVNEALTEGWELVRRECFVTGADRVTTFYAELERMVEEPEDEDDADEGLSEWKISRDPAYPYKCVACGCKSHQALKNCPFCNRIMINPED
jgi:hypothetical protein